MRPFSFMRIAILLVAFISFTFNSFAVSTTTMPSTGKPNTSASGFYPKKNGQFKTKYFENVELIINPGVSGQGVQVKFEDQSQLRSQADQTITFKAVETWSNQVIPVSPTGNPVATPAQIRSAYLTFNVNSYEWLHQIPLATLNRIYGDTTLQANFVPFTQHLFLLDDVVKIIWTKSYVQFAGTDVNEDSFSFLFGIHYELFPDKQTV